MSVDEQRDRAEVVDEEGLVDRERKRMILEARRDVRKWKAEIYPEVEVSGDVDRAAADKLWGERVREYLLTIEPLLREGELAGSEEVYEQATVGNVTVEPPEEYVEAAGLPRGPEIAQRDFWVFGEIGSKTIQIQGLRSVIENEAVTASWDLTVKRESGPHGGKSTEHVTESRPIPKPVLRDAVRIAESWLQSVDLGIEVGSGRPESNYSGEE